MPYLPCVEIEPDQPANRAIIWLHGLGADGNDFAPLVPHLRLPESVQVRFIFPHAPKIPVTINGGMVMPAWYDITDMTIDRKVDTAQLRASADSVADLIARENERGIPSEHIVIAGFSQGGAVAYEAALSHSERLAGLLVLSSYLATAPSIELHPANQDLPVMIQHGRQDPIVAERLGQQAKSWMMDHGYKVDYQAFDMEHQVCPEQIQEISNWLTKVLAT
ncbi:carboxylesterase [Pseudidiomarina salinarum]|uniref:Carboxylesterase n=1 Tax=Pseudidiomarina salinarum TaxID=435908 RepID=A0A094IT80_9GAMM|nr:dienelactone hydrolase family protein [Pseudidiomarina salinarum]KFZ30875.1 carboxylesterase [Pseudidiomarina salinarum]RUO71354.1 carboxylesterase [Pseudidiomarina salinarum]